ncbi:actin-like family protein ARP4a, putative [Eimeria tenella]|uniref:Actin-like family protein ARP4a, putative n=1 Tax=Eimeria tenella TaxID=5802 RepID=U6L342_EIMTE|nr:actin-like family protein ARP4a, putative [Eimeria tenella]CDJ43014.1 actin-like family protein ARP4a, putative [Eimeria tenella]|eukprot:XP_013233764.1 actin-like family protein ARP4a, putative [Eimeria tenella]
MSGLSASPPPASGAKGSKSTSNSSNNMKTPIGGEDVCAVVVQLGSSTVSVGYAQEDHPRIVADALVGRRKLRLQNKQQGDGLFCGECCCCRSQASLCAPPDTDIRDIQNQQHRRRNCLHWTKSSGVSPSVFYSRGPFIWPSGGNACCSCQCSHQQIVFPVSLELQTPHTEVDPILATPKEKPAGATASPALGGIASSTGPVEESKKLALQLPQSQQHGLFRQLDRSAFSTAVRICIEGNVHESEANKRTLRPPETRRRQQQQQQQQKAEEANYSQHSCSCCCTKREQRQQTAAGCNGVFQTAHLPEGSPKALNISLTNSSSSKGGSASVEAFGCSPFGGLGVWTHEHPVLVVEPTGTSKALRQSLAAAVFEDLQAPAAFFVPAAAAAAFSMGRSTALVVELGAAGGSVAAVVDGYTLHRSTKLFPVGGDFLDGQIELVLKRHLQQQQQQQHHVDELFLPLFSNRSSYNCSSRGNCSRSLLRLSTLALCRRLREACCVVREFGDANLPLSVTAVETQDKGAAYTPEDPYHFELPDGSVINCGAFRETIGEVLFRPTEALRALQQLQGISPAESSTDLLQGFKGITEVVADCLYDCDVDLRRDLLSAVILTGGLSLTPGLASRFAAELDSETFPLTTSHSGLKSRVVFANSYAEKKSAAWLGGSILASLGTFQQMWISKQEYEEHGFGILDQRAL